MNPIIIFIIIAVFFFFGWAAHDTYLLSKEELEPIAITKTVTSEPEIIPELPDCVLDETAISCDPDILYIPCEEEALVEQLNICNENKASMQDTVDDMQVTIDERNQTIADLLEILK